MKKKWNIYLAETIWSRCEDGNCRKNYLSLKPIAKGLEDFRTECWPIIDELRIGLVSDGAWEGCSSRSDEWCFDHLTRRANDGDLERDDLLPGLIGIEIITTRHELALKSA